MHVIIIYNCVLTNTYFVLEKYDNIFRHLERERKCAGDERSMVAIDWLALSNAFLQMCQTLQISHIHKLSTNLFFFAFLISAI